MSIVSAHHRSGTWVDGHYRNGFWVEGHHRGDTTVGEYERSEYGQVPVYDASWRLRSYTSSLTYPTTCWECGEPVFFYRSENGGCALFDELGWPWPIHECWQRHKDSLLHRVGAQLDDLGFDGRSYTQSRKPLKKTKQQQSIHLRGFVEKAVALENQSSPVVLRSCRGASALRLVAVRFVLHDRPDHFLRFYVPENHQELFAPYSIHEIEASWIKRGNRNLCLVTSTRILRAHTRPSGRAKSILELNRRCHYCNIELGTHAWGLDSEGNEECAYCGRMRFHLSSRVFLERVKRISQSRLSDSHDRI